MTITYGYMMNVKMKGILTGCVVVALFSPMSVNAATMDELEAQIAELEQTLEKAEQEWKKLEKILESASMLKLELKKAKREREKLAQDQKKLERVVEVVEAIELPKRDEQATVVSLYGRFWPRVTYRDGKDTSTDITDALSRVGLKAESRVNNNLTTFMGGEWDIDLEAERQLGRRPAGLHRGGTLQVRVSGHRETVGRTLQDRDGSSDIFYNRRSPYGFNEEGGFRSNNQIQYANRFGDFKLAAMLQVTARLALASESAILSDRTTRVTVRGAARECSKAAASEPRRIRTTSDAASIGIAYDGPFYLGVSYLRANAPKGTASVGPDQTFYGADRNLSRLGGSDTRRDFIGVDGRWQVTDDLYLGFTYQYLRHVEGAINPGDLELKQNRYHWICWAPTISAAGGRPLSMSISMTGTAGTGVRLTRAESDRQCRRAGQGVESGHGRVRRMGAR